MFKNKSWFPVKVTTGIRSMLSNHNGKLCKYTVKTILDFLLLLINVLIFELHVYDVYRVFTAITTTTHFC